MPETLSSPSHPTQRPVEDQEDKSSFQVQIADVSHAVASNAIDSAEELINQQTQAQEGQRLGRSRAFLRRVWYGNIARDFYRQRQIRHGRQEVLETGNIYTLDEGSQADHDRETGAVVERLASDNLHEGETNEDLESTEHGQMLMSQIRQLIGEYARGAIDHDALIEERTRILSQYGARVHEQDRNRGLMYADNILEVAENVRSAHEHQEGLERLDEAISGRVGEARMGVRTEVRMEATDRILDWMHRNHMTFANEAVIGAAVGIAIGLAKFTTKKAITATGAVVGLGVGAGLIAGAREHLRVGQERRTHHRQRAEGQQLPEEGATRREQFEVTRYETVSAEELTNNIQEALDGLDSTNPDSVRALLAHVSNTRARIAMSDERDIDLIEYSAKTAVESERLDLDILLAQASEALQQAINDSPEGIFPSSNLDELVGINLDAINEYLEADIDQKDHAFRRLRLRRTLKMAGIAFIAGETIGLAAQEIHALTDSGLRGVFGDDGGDRRSLLAGWFRGSGNGSDGSELHREFFEGPEFLEDQTHKVGVDLPEGYQLIETRPGEQFGWDIIGPDGKPVLDRGLEWDTQGNLAKWVRHGLTEKGWNLHQDTLTYNDPDTVTQSITRSPHEFIEKHPSEFVRFHRELWYDNNTPAPNFDLNELRQYWGGENGTGIDKNGNYVFNIANMRSDWSFHGPESANAPQLIQEGKMYVALSMTRGTQQWVEMIPVDANGNAVIDADSFAGKNLFEAVDGHASFKGAFAEAVQVTGQTQDGGVSGRMLATVVGENRIGAVTDTVQRTITEQHTHFVTALEVPSEDLPIEIPPVLPIYSRRGLEDLRPAAGPGYGYRGSEGYVGYVGGRTPEARSRRGLAPFAPEIEADPDAKIDANKSTARYFRSLRPSYMKILGNMKKQLEREPKAEKPKVVVMIPAAAHQEGKNIYRTLLQYANQQDIEANDFELVIFANVPPGAKRDKTVSEVRRFQKDHPEINVRMVERRLSQKEANIGWVRKAITDTILTDLTERDINLNEVLLVSNDADAEWIDPRYIKTIIEKANAQPEVDAFLGAIDWGYEAYKAFPETLAATRFMQMIEVYMRKRRGYLGSSGANFAFRPGAYTAVGGYNSLPDSEAGEDVQLGNMIKNMRSGAGTRRPIAWLGRSSEVTTSARRALDKLFKDGGAPVRQWDDTFGAYDALRTRDFDLTNFNFDDPAAVGRLVRGTEDMLNDTLNVYRRSLKDKESKPYRSGRLGELSTETIRNLNMMLSVIGVKVRWQPNGKFNIADASRMLTNLQRWQSAH